ncbi:hypothetical protein [Fulvimarina sp. MAC8]|uniref:hypothetical protein n=1 Tax=Fulvimarina sp. MAC8 TaxID=3162874 RepID=UPI0032EC4C75
MSEIKKGIRNIRNLARPRWILGTGAEHDGRGELFLNGQHRRGTNDRAIWLDFGKFARRRFYSEANTTTPIGKASATNPENSDFQRKHDRRKDNLHTPYTCILHKIAGSANP